MNVDSYFHRLSLFDNRLIHHLKILVGVEKFTKKSIAIIAHYHIEVTRHRAILVRDPRRRVSGINTSGRAGDSSGRLKAPSCPTSFILFVLLILGEPGIVYMDDFAGI